MDPRYEKLAELLTGYSTELKAGEKVLIDAIEVPELMVIALVRAARKRGAMPFVNIRSTRVSRELLKEGEAEQYEVMAGYELAQMKAMDAYIALRGAGNIFETSDVGAEKMGMAMGKMKKVLDWRVNRTKWVVLRWPTGSMAQAARMSTEAFEDFYFRVCTFDYRRYEKGAKALNELMGKTDKVHIVSPGTDLRFSIKGIGVETCDGLRNIPDGEVFTAPVKESVEGYITYNTSTVYHGVSFENIRFEFKKGKIVKAEAGKQTEALNKILDVDKGARYIGEFAIGFHPHILEPMQDILFDEKIAGSLHFTPGQAYEKIDNGNRSQVHWDLVLIQRPEYGGGEIWFDGKLIRKDGLFVVKGLDKLNPENLLSDGGK